MYINAKKEQAHFISILSNDYEQLTGKWLSDVATVGMKTTCLDQELDQNSATCLRSGGGHCMLGGLNFRLCFAKTAPGYLEKL